MYHLWSLFCTCCFLLCYLHDVYTGQVIGLFLQPTLMHNCTNTASGILALISGCTLHWLRADSEQSLLSTGVVYSHLGERGYQILCLCSCSSWGWACQGPKHVEDSSVTYMLLLNCVLKLVEEIILYYDALLKKHQIREFKSGGLNERHVVTTWKLGNHLSIRL